ncbi:MAG: shikimate kinase, partial [Candidatus Marinimicrobia bacterium]|nr:shikimate kinase [Candidatus Neomarinimicrobiota bacterium]
MSTHQDILANSYQLNGNNLFLIGMMGSWKSTVGKKLAIALNMEFVDTDDVIEEVTEMKVSDIFSEFGEVRFREMELAFFKEKSKQTGHIFSTGGGIVLQTENRNILKND